MKNWTLGVWTLGMAAGPCLLAQQAAVKAEPAMGRVAGQVTCADTNAPARFALVALEPVPPEKTAESKGPKRDEQPAQRADTTAMTDLEGHFALEKIPPGRYYVFGSLAGYVNPLALFNKAQLKELSAETRKQLAAAVPVIDVEPNQVAAVTLRLERASEVSGTVLYDDGSPAIGLGVQLLRKGKYGKLDEVRTELVGGMFSSQAMTDDRGRYRVIGAPAGEYTVRVSLLTEKIQLTGLLGEGGTSIDIHNEDGGALSIYLGNGFRKKDAKLTKVGEGEAAAGLDMTIQIAGLHTVHGTVTAKRDGHALNKAEVQLVYADDQELVRSVHADKDGNFTLDYVPEDKYLLKAKGAADVEEVEVHPYPEMTVKQDKVLHSYGDAEQPLTVQGDVGKVEVAVPEPTATASAALSAHP